MIPGRFLAFEPNAPSRLARRHREVLSTTSIATARTIMLWWALVFFIIAIVAAIFGFAGIVSAAASVAQVIFYVALVLFVLSFIVHLAGGGRRATTAT